MEKPRDGLIAGSDGEMSATAEMVFEAEEVQTIGLLDANGNPIYRRRHPIGFDLEPRR